MSGPRVIGMIPARFASTRFPGKMLTPIFGKPLVQWTYENAVRCSVFSDVVVATDDDRIAGAVEGFGGKVVMTSPDCINGTERLADAIKRHREFDDCSLVVNVQGDEPCVTPEAIAAVVKRMELAPDAVMSTAATPLASLEEAQRPHLVKCVFDQKGYALYFSRSPIPFFRHGFPSLYRHLGLYCFRRDFLLLYPKLTCTPLQQAEDLEQLRILEHGYRIQVALVNETTIGVDTPEDVKRVEPHLKR